jgi:hypothetical protein
MFARTARGRHFFPLDKRLKLRKDHWSEGAAKVAAHQGLQAKSFDLAAEAYCEATGGHMSGDSLTRITEGFGKKLETQRVAEAEMVYKAEVPPEAEQVVKSQAPIAGKANLSTDGGMVLIRGEGWKEVKMSVVSEVVMSPVTPSPENPAPDPKVNLTNHSYQAGLWDADRLRFENLLPILQLGRPKWIMPAFEKKAIPSAAEQLKAGSTRLSIIA